MSVLIRPCIPAVCGSTCTATLARSVASNRCCSCSLHSFLSRNGVLTPPRRGSSGTEARRPRPTTPAVPSELRPAGPVPSPGGRPQRAPPARRRGLQQPRQHTHGEVPQAHRFRLQRHVTPVPLAELGVVPGGDLPQDEQQARCPVVRVEGLDDLGAAERLPLLHLAEQGVVPAQSLAELPQARPVPRRTGPGLRPRPPSPQEFPYDNQRVRQPRSPMSKPPLPPRHSSAISTVAASS